MELEILWEKNPHLLEKFILRAIEQSDFTGPRWAELRVALAYTLLHQRRFRDAREVLKQVLDRWPTDAQALFCESQIALFLQEKDAWSKLDARWAVHNTGERPIPRDREWDGSPLDRKTVLLAGEGGLGDQIHFARYMPRLKKAGSGRVMISLDRRLALLFRTVADIGGIIELAPGKNLVGPDVEYDVGVPMMTAPSMLGNSFDDVPAPIPFAVPDESVESARHEIERGARASRLNVGLNWLSNKEVRCIPLQFFRELADVPGVRLFALGENHKIASEANDFPIINLGSNIQQTAASMMALDLVITVDSMAAHLAGSLGRPTWLLLHRLPEWRWGLDGESTPWYPSMQLFRRERDWPDLIHKVAQKLSLAISMTLI